MHDIHKEIKKWLVGAFAVVVIGVILGVLVVMANVSGQGGRSGVLGGIASFLHLKAVTPLAKNSGPTLYAPTNDYEAAVINAVKKASPAVVSIVISEQVPIVEQCPYNPFGNLPPEFQQFFGNTSNMTQPCDTGKTQLQEVGGGSGFIISQDGLILTNKHVVSDASASYTVITNDGKKYDAKVLARDPSQDFAVVKIIATGLPTVTLGDPNALKVGEWVVAIGSPFGFDNSVTAGIVSAKGRSLPQENFVPFIQTDVAVNPGNSGGPLFNMNGEVVGINSQIYSRTGGYMGLSFAVPILVCLVLQLGSDRGIVSAQQPAALVIEGGTLIDGNGGAPVRDSAIVIQGNKISAVGAKGQIAWGDPASGLRRMNRSVEHSVINATTPKVYSMSRATR